jgi:hypothetical protein
MGNIMDENRSGQIDKENKDEVEKHDEARFRRFFCFYQHSHNYYNFELVAYMYLSQEKSGKCDSPRTSDREMGDKDCGTRACLINGLSILPSFSFSRDFFFLFSQCFQWDGMGRWIISRMDCNWTSGLSKEIHYLSIRGGENLIPTSYLYSL